MKVKSATFKLLIAGAAILFAVPAGQAFAGHLFTSGTPGTGGTTNGVWLTDSHVWTIGRRAMTTANSNGVYAAYLDYNATDMSPALSSPSSCPDSSYDVCVYDSAYGDVGLAGWNQCAGTTSGSHASQTCSLAYAKFNQTYSWDPHALACHELAHGIGLQHSNDVNSCVYNPALSSRRYLAAHDIEDINWYY